MAPQRGGCALVSLTHFDLQRSITAPPETTSTRQHRNRSALSPLQSKVQCPAGLTALVLSQAARVGKSLVSILEGGGGRVPRLDTVELLSVALSLSSSFLAFGLDGQFESERELRSKGFAARLAEARRERGLSMRAVDKRAGISPGSTRSQEAGTMPSLDTLELIAKALSVSPAWLAFGEGPRELVRRRSKQDGDGNYSR